MTKRLPSPLSQPAGVRAAGAVGLSRVAGQTAGLPGPGRCANRRQETRQHRLRELGVRADHSATVDNAGGAACGAGPEKRLGEDPIAQSRAVRSARAWSEDAAGGAARVPNPADGGSSSTLASDHARTARASGQRRAASATNPGTVVLRAGSIPGCQVGSGGRGDTPPNLSRRTASAVRAALDVGHWPRSPQPVQRGPQTPTRPSWKALARRCSRLRLYLTGTAHGRSNERHEDRPGRLSLDRSLSTARRLAPA